MNPDKRNKIMNRETMTPNDEFAKAAMETYMQICEPFKVNDGFIANSAYTELAKYSYEIADAMMAEKYKRDTNLCDSCKFCFATCVSDPESGLGLGYDNIIKCKTYRKKEKHKVRTFFRKIYFKIISTFTVWR